MRIAALDWVARRRMIAAAVWARANLLRSAAIEVLVVCTGNLCRSPMAEGLLRAHLERRDVVATVSSAGSMAWAAPLPTEAVSVMAALGIDISQHRPRALEAPLIERADLVLGMTRDHVARVRALAPDAADRAFLVAELVRLGERVGPRRPGEEARTWLRRVAAARPDAPVPGRAGDEVTDPLGGPIGAYRETASRLDAQLRRVADLLAVT